MAAKNGDLATSNQTMAYPLTRKSKTGMTTAAASYFSCDSTASHRTGFLFLGGLGSHQVLQFCQPETGRRQALERYRCCPNQATHS